MAGMQHADSYFRTFLATRVPSLQHAGFNLAESSAIAEYLEEVFPPPAHQALFPADAQSRARARQLMAWMRSDLSALREERSTITMFYRFALPALSPNGQRDAERLVHVAEQLVPPDNGPLFGSWSLVDSELSFMLHRLILNGDPLPGRLRSYAEGQWARPTVREYVDHARPATVPPGYWTYSGMREPPAAG